MKREIVLLLIVINLVRSLECRCVNGICIGNNETECLCHYGWTGVLCNYRTCEPEIDCYSEIGNGRCNKSINECECNEPWLGDVCNFKPCDSSSFLNCKYGGCYTVQISLYTSETKCYCINGWTGDLCDIPINDNIEEYLEEEKIIIDNEEEEINNNEEEGGSMESSMSDVMIGVISVTVTAVLILIVILMIAYLNREKDREINIDHRNNINRPIIYT